MDTMVGMSVDSAVATLLRKIGYERNEYSGYEIIRIRFDIQIVKAVVPKPQPSEKGPRLQSLSNPMTCVCLANIHQMQVSNSSLALLEIALLCDNHSDWFQRLSINQR